MQLKDRGAVVISTHGATGIAKPLPRGKGPLPKGLPAGILWANG